MSVPITLLSHTTTAHINLQTSIAALIHSVVCYLKPIPALKAFSGPRRPPANATLAHVYAIKNVYTGVIRAYAAYEITNRPLYNLAILTYVGVLWLFVTETMVYRTIRWRESVIPYLNAGVGIVWMVGMRGWYLRGE